MSMRQIVVHGHFYQPPREEPWLELVPAERSAAPDHDWNERITRQCYRPLALGRVLDAQGRIIRVINAYAWCSFDIGPTLFRWLDRHATDVRDAIIAGDRESIRRLGAGNALAMPFHHAILPLMSRRDKVSNVRWGICDFRARFGREPEGMWLPETAVDEETLAVLADERIRFTVLSPTQVRDAPAFGMPGRWRGPGGREVAIFAYDGAASHQVPFGDVLQDAARWEAALTATAVPDDHGPALVAIATDGETFGHHHRFGDVALVSLIDRLGRRTDAALTNFAAALRDHPPVQDVTIVSPSSWSCPHGVERWRTECGCRFEPGTSQAWRAPLRQGLEALASGITEAAQRQWPATAGDIWTAREVAGPDLAGAPQLPAEARQLLEVLQHAMAMFTSCAWFFDDLGRLEPLIVLRHATRAIDLLARADRERLTPAILATLAGAWSNDPEKGTGADIWNRDVMPYARGPARLVAGLAALRMLSPGSLDDVVMPAHTWRTDGDDIVIEHRRTGHSCRWKAEPVVTGVFATQTHVGPAPNADRRAVGVIEYPEPIRAMLRELAAPMIHDAALTSEDAAALRAGTLTPDLARERAVRGAWLLIERDGVEEAGIVLHGVLDLYDLDGESPSDVVRAEAWQRLSAMPASATRDALAERLGLTL
jgi:hypothetical protein